MRSVGASKATAKQRIILSPAICGSLPRSLLPRLWVADCEHHFRGKCGPDAGRKRFEPERASGERVRQIELRALEKVRAAVSARMTRRPGFGRMQTPNPDSTSWRPQTPTKPSFCLSAGSISEWCSPISTCRAHERHQAGPRGAKPLASDKDFRHIGTFHGARRRPTDRRPVSSKPYTPRQIRETFRL
jgi:hypothetical protein